MISCFFYYGVYFFSSTFLNICIWFVIVVHLYIYIYIYIYIYREREREREVLFGPVKPELGVIPSGQKPFNSEHLDFPGKEPNVTEITEQ